MTYVLIDADSIVYAAGFSTERNRYCIHGQEFLSEDDAFEYAAFTGSQPDEVQVYREVDPVHAALGNAKRTVQGILRDLNATDYKVYLTDGLSFRKDVATIQPYKGQRSLPKPVWYNEIREYLQRKYKAEVFTEIEADDAVAIDSVKYPDAVIVHIDKDLNQLPGVHWNFRTKTRYTVTHEQGLRNFYRQMLTGDVVDNIPGLYRITGRKCTKDILAGLEDQVTNAAMYRYVHSVYISSKPDLDPAVLLELGRLLWLKRDLEDTWRAPCD